MKNLVFAVSISAISAMSFGDGLFGNNLTATIGLPTYVGLEHSESRMYSIEGTVFATNEIYAFGGVGSEALLVKDKNSESDAKVDIDLDSISVGAGFEKLLADLSLKKCLFLRKACIQK